ncbi:alkaline phosphatase D family protein [Actinopolymorpha sp. B9G3]|uniref:alkaline phosphatase D family protein n=1 Tax=Actinopolymorpha sp. B9G3 TaxID=3158970 RepID=UPI0032D9688D
MRVRVAPEERLRVVRRRRRVLPHADQPARDRIVAAFTERGVANPVVLSGDIHRNMAADIKADFDDPGSETVATEFIGTSISSGLDGADMDELGPEFLANQHLRFYNSLRGYVRFQVIPDHLVSDFRVVPFVRQQGAPISTRASFLTENGRPGLEQIADNPPVGRRFAVDIPPPEQPVSPYE